MDTQGNDMAVFESGGEIVNSFVGLQSELSVKRLYKDSSTFDQTIAFYRSKGFELSTFVPSHAWSFPRLVEVDCIMFNPAALPKG
jgi:hypothetical protein